MAEQIYTFQDFAILHAYNRWWDDPHAFAGLPAFRRDVFDALYADVNQLPQMVSVTGPRRVGKSTLLLQCIRQLIEDASEPQAQARRIAYFSMDDPALDLPGVNRDEFFDALAQAARAAAREGPTYLFLDEIQRFPRWELYLKKFYDLKTPVRFVVSGSASSPIFRKSRESLLGRIRDFHVLPFSYREWVCARPLPEGEPILLEGHRMSNAWSKLGADIAGRAPAELVAGLDKRVNEIGPAAHRVLPLSVEHYLFEGGFPEAWALPDLLAKQDYLYRNQVERVIFEDLLVAAEFRKPEMLRRFYLGLLRDPGRETNLSKLSKDIQLARSTIESYFPLLEATDLVWRLQKHTSTKATPKAGNFKTYLVDLAVRNAVMKLSEPQMISDPTLMGAYAENVVGNHLRRWPGIVELGYWRRNDDEIDFIVDLGSWRIAVEVKYRSEVQEKDVLKAARLAAQLDCAACIVVSKHAMAPEALDTARAETSLPLAVVPLPAFLLLF